MRCRTGGAVSTVSTTANAATRLLNSAVFTWRAENSRIVGLGCGVMASVRNDCTVAKAWHKRSLAFEAKALPYSFATVPRHFAISPFVKISSFGHSRTAFANSIVACRAATLALMGILFWTLCSLFFIVHLLACRLFRLHCYWISISFIL